MTYAWHIAITEPGREMVAKAHLQRQGYRVLYPHVETTVRRRGVVVSVLRPRYHRYLFVEIGPGQSVYDVNETVAISTLIYGTHGPLVVPERVMAAELERCNADGLVIEDNPPTVTYTIGQQVNLRPDDPFSDWIGTVQGIDKHGRPIIMMNILGGSRRVEAAGLKAESGSRTVARAGARRRLGARGASR